MDKIEEITEVEKKIIKKNKIFKISWIVMLILLVLIFIIAISPISLQNDTFYDILLGNRYLNTGMFSIDDYSIHTGLVYQTHHYIVSIIDYLAFNLASYNGLYILELLLTSIIAALLYLTNRTLLKSKFLAYILVFVQLFMLTPFISVRAQMFSYIIFILEILFMQKFIKTNKLKYAIFLGVLPLFLINFHSGVIYFYFIVLAVFICNLLRIKLIRIENDNTITKKQLITLIYVGLVGAVLTIINPYGINGILYGLKTLDNSFINNYIQEFQPYNIKGLAGIPVIIYLGFCTMCLILSEKKIKIHEILLFLGTVFMMLLSIRHLSLMIIMSIVIFPHIEDVYEKFKKWMHKDLIEGGKKAIKITIYILFGIIYIIFIGNITLDPKRSYEYVSYGEYPVQATQYIKDNIGSDARIFNEYAWGSYLMFNDIKVFIDSRCDLYTKEYNKGVTVADDYMKTVKLEVDYNETVNKYNIEYFLIKKDSSLAKMLLLDVKYKKIYEDNLSCIIKVAK